MTSRLVPASARAESRGRKNLGRILHTAEREAHHKHTYFPLATENFSRPKNFPSPTLPLVHEGMQAIQGSSRAGGCGLAWYFQEQAAGSDGGQFCGTGACGPSDHGNFLAASTGW
jgi:hypothetical protein